ncbi:MAG: adenylate/guanylate cyclase domain-containing protein [Pseudomonadota bacterium]
MDRLKRFFTEPTPWIQPGGLRSFRVFNVAMVAALGVHALVSALFLALGVPQLPEFNLLSAAVYLVALLLNRRGQPMAAVAVALLELTAHQALCAHVIGLETGFQYYLLTVVVVVFFLPPGRAVAKVGLLLATAAAYLAVWAYGSAHPPTHPLGEGVSAAFHALNVVMLIVLLALFGWTYARAVVVAERRLEEEYQRSEALLHNILPAPIAQRLKRHPGVIADRFEQATVLFADIVDFTPLAERTEPEALVRLLDEVFSRVDELAARWGLEKIKTIGDAYMVVAGVPEPRPDHAAAMAGFALELMEQVQPRGPRGAELRLRIGIHSGPLVAGVIGKKRLLYDLWGDTVNLAARMESHGIPGAIQVSRATHDLLGAAFVLEARGVVQIKGKGPLETWMLRGRAGEERPAPCPPPA